MKRLIIYILFLFAAVYAQNLEDLYNDYTSSIERATRIAAQLQQTDSLSQALAAEINALRAAKSIRKNKRQLYKLLPQAEALAVQQQSYLDELTLLTARIEFSRRRLTLAYQAKIDSSTSAPSAKGKPASIDFYKNRLASLQISKFNPPIQASEAVTIDADDTPQIIQAKADLYRDRADKYRDKAQELQDRRKQVLQTLKLRQRVSEMVSDVQLTDSRDEIDVAQLQAAGDEKTLETDAENFPSYRNDYGWGNSNIANTTSVRQANNLLNYDFRSPTANFEEYMQNLQAEEQKLLTQADSLSKIADEFSTIHQHMTDQLK